jgi:hypothetical protein
MLVNFIGMPILQEIELELVNLEWVVVLLDIREMIVYLLLWLVVVQDIILMEVHLLLG